jgi:hypothetical protein
LRRTPTSLPLNLTCLTTVLAMIDNFNIIIY